jgi:dTDP-4-dehydrorhamnose reductase
LQDIPRPLIVGASGQVGQALGTLLGRDALLASRMARQPRSLELDLSRLAQSAALARDVFEAHNVSAVYCVGAATDVERCEREPEWAMSTNCHGPAALAAAAGDRPFVFFSTDYVFNGRAPAGPYGEDAPTHPLSAYGRSKLLGEQAVQAAHPSPLILRTNVVYGPDPQGKNFLYTLRGLLSAGTPMRVPTDQINNPVYNQDLAAATLALVGAGLTGIYNIGGPVQLSRYDFALLAAGLLGLDSSLVQPVTTDELSQTAARPLQSGLRTEKLRAALPHLHLRSPEDGIRALNAGFRSGQPHPAASKAILPG